MQYLNKYEKAAQRAVWKTIASLLDEQLQPCMLPVLVYEEYMMTLGQERPKGLREKISE